MNIKTFIAAAVVATTAACNQAEQAEQTAVSAAEMIELNEDGSIVNAAQSIKDDGSTKEVQQ